MSVECHMHWSPRTGSDHCAFYIVPGDNFLPLNKALDFS